MLYLTYTSFFSDHPAICCAKSVRIMITSFSAIIHIRIYIVSVS